jgi:hypothetical protein
MQYATRSLDALSPKLGRKMPFLYLRRKFLSDEICGVGTKNAFSVDFWFERFVYGDAVAVGETIGFVR